MENSESQFKDLPDFLKDPNKAVIPPAGDGDRAKFTGRINEIASLPNPEPKDLAELSINMMSVMGGKEEKEPDGFFIRKSDFANDRREQTGFAAVYKAVEGKPEKQIQQLSIYLDAATKIVIMEFEDGKYKDIGIADGDDMIFGFKKEDLESKGIDPSTYTPGLTTRPLNEGEVKQYIDKLSQKFKA